MLINRIPSRANPRRASSDSIRRVADIRTVSGAAPSGAKSPSLASRAHSRQSPAHRRSRRAAGAIALALALAAGTAVADAGSKPLDERLEGIDAGTGVDIGVHVRRLADDKRIDHDTDRRWYLASTIKVPLAVAVLQHVEAGDVELDHEIELAESDWVDGTGELLYADPGSEHTIEELIGHSLRNSDSTATDMLIRHLGEDAFNDQIREGMVSDGFGPITTILQVRHDAWSEVHPDAEELTNMDFIDLKTVEPPERYDMVLDKLDIEPEEADAESMEAAFERYYERGRNSGDLRAFADLLERLVRGRLLEAAHTETIIEHMLSISTGDDRIQAGLPPDTPFAQKTGTQVSRACNVGVIHPEDPDRATIVTACAEGFDDIAEAEEAFRLIGEALGQSGFAD